MPGPLSRVVIPAPPDWDRGHGPPSATQGGGPWRPRALRLTENPTRRYLPGGPGPEPRRLAAPGVKRVPAVLARRPFQERPGRSPPGYSSARVVPGDRPARGLLRPAAQCLSCLSEPAAPYRRPLMGRYSTGRKRARTSGGGFHAGDLLGADLWRRDAAGMSAGFLLGADLVGGRFRAAARVLTEFDPHPAPTPPNMTVSISETRLIYQTRKRTREAGRSVEVSLYTPPLASRPGMSPGARSVTGRCLQPG